MKCFILILIGFCGISACNPDSKPTTVNITQPSGRSLDDATITFGRGSSMPLYGKTNSRGRFEHEGLSGHGILYVDYNEIMIGKEVVKTSWPVNLLWPVNIDLMIPEGAPKAGTITVLRADKSIVANLTAFITYPPFEGPDSNPENRAIQPIDGKTVRLNSRKPLRLHLKSGGVSVILQYPESGLPESFDLLWPE